MALSKHNNSDPVNDNMVELTSLTTIYSYLHLLHRFQESISTNAPSDASTLILLLKCGTLFFADAVRREALETALEEGFISSVQAKAIRRAVWELCGELVPFLKIMGDGK